MATTTDKAVVETVIAGNYVEMEAGGNPNTVKSKLSKLFWHGGSVYDAWFSCASNQVYPIWILPLLAIDLALIDFWGLIILAS